MLRWVKMKLNRSAAARKAAVTRKRRAAARKAVLARKRRAAAQKAAIARKINAAMRNGADADLHALSIRQPYVEQIMRGTKRIEYRSMPTRIRGQILIYASVAPGSAEEFEKLRLRPGDLPTGVIVGAVEIVDCSGEPGDYEWHLAHPMRLRTPVPPKNHPQPAWFRPF